MNRIKELRKAAGITQAQLAELLQQADPRIDHTMISRFETGICVPNADVLESLARVLGAFAKDIYPDECNFPTLCHNAPKKGNFEANSAYQQIIIMRKEISRMFEAILDHPDIRSAMLTGYPVGANDPELPSCPECGEQAKEFYRDTFGHIIGCSFCLHAVSAYELLVEQEDDPSYIF